MTAVTVLLEEKELPKRSEEIILHSSVAIEISIMSCNLWSRRFSATYNELSGIRQHVNE